MSIPHPQDAGFTPRYVWRGRERCIVWRHCGVDARQGRKDVKGPDNVFRAVTIVECGACGLKWMADGA